MEEVEKNWQLWDTHDGIGDAEIGRRHCVVTDVMSPSAEEVDNHNLTHVPYQPWCPHCVRGRGKNDAHRRHHQTAMHELKNPDMVAYSIDCAFLGMEDDEESDKIKTIVLTNNKDGAIKGHQVPQKGVRGESTWVPRRIARDVDDQGVAGINTEMRSDQEPAITDVQDRMEKYLSLIHI